MLDFIERDPEKIHSESVAQFEELTDRVLYDGQPEAVFLRLMSYRESLVRMGLNYAANQNLVNHANGQHLDELGVLVGVTRIPAKKAEATLRIVPSKPDTPLPAGTVIQSRSSKIKFESLVATRLPESGAVLAFRALSAGADANGLTDIEVLISNAADIASVSVVEPSHGGAAEEDDDRLRQRIKESPEHYSVAGPEGAYKYHAMSASVLIKDVSVLSSTPGQVDVYVLYDGDDDIKPAVDKALNAEEVRPLTDYVVVHDATEKQYSLKISYWIEEKADRLLVEKELIGKPEDENAKPTGVVFVFTEQLQQAFGLDVIRSQINKVAMSVSGMYKTRVELFVNDLPVEDVMVAGSEVASLQGEIVFEYKGTDKDLERG